MSQNILVTGAAGYIGGSVVADFIAHSGGPIKTASIFAAVRSEEQVQALSKLDVNVIKLDLKDETAVSEAVLRNEIDVVVHTAGAIETPPISHLIKALGQRRQASGKETYFIHTSITTLWSAEGGWPYGEVKDTDPIYEKEKEIGGPHPVRLTNIAVTELAKAHGVTSFIVPVPMTYGRGSGEWRKLSVSIPAYIRTSIKDKKVHKFDKDSAPPATHVSDLAALYTLLVEKILQKEPIPSGENGYYFGTVHRSPWWEVMQRLTDSLYARGLVTEPTPEVWPSYEAAAESLGFPAQYIRAMGTSSGDVVAVNSYRLGWKPKWDESRFLESLDDEVQAVQELDTIKATIFDSLLPSGKSADA